MRRLLYLEIVKILCHINQEHISRQIISLNPNNLIAENNLFSNQTISDFNAIIERAEIIGVSLDESVTIFMILRGVISKYIERSSNLSIEYPPEFEFKHMINIIKFVSKYYTNNSNIYSMYILSHYVKSLEVLHVSELIHIYEFLFIHNRKYSFILLLYQEIAKSLGISNFSCSIKDIVCSKHTNFKKLYIFIKTNLNLRSLTLEDLTLEDYDLRPLMDILEFARHIEKYNFNKIGYEFNKGPMLISETKAVDICMITNKNVAININQSYFYKGFIEIAKKINIVSIVFLELNVSEIEFLRFIKLIANSLEQLIILRNLKGFNKGLKIDFPKLLILRINFENRNCKDFFKFLKTIIKKAKN